MAEFLASNLRSALGIVPNLSTVDTANSAKVENERSFDMWVHLFGTAGPDPALAWSDRVTGGAANSRNLGAWTDPAIDQGFAQLDAMVDQAQKTKLAQQLEKDLVVNKAWYGVLGDQVRGEAWRGWLKNYNGFASSEDTVFMQWTDVWISK